MTLMLHAGAKEVDYAALRELTMPVATPTHVPIPHFRVVDLMKSTLAMYGHEVTEEHYGITEDGARFFGLLSLKSGYGGYEDTVGLRNSHDKRFPIGVGFGSRVFVCDNLAFIGDHVVRRKHTANAKRDLPGLVGELVEPLALQRETQHQTLLTYQKTPLTDIQADHAIMSMYRQGVINVQRIADVSEQWEKPSYDWGDRTAWRLFNATTYALTGKVVENNDVTPRLHKIIDGACTLLKEDDCAIFTAASKASQAAGYLRAFSKRNHEVSDNRRQEDALEGHPQTAAGAEESGTPDATHAL